MVSLAPADGDEARLLRRALRAERSVQVLAAVVRLLLVLVRTGGVRLDAAARLPEGAAKADLLRAIDRCRRTLHLSAALRVLGLQPSRYHAWRRAERSCGLDDRPSCPRSSPTQLAPEEVSVIKEMVLDPLLRHLSMRALALLAQRTARVFASASTWGRLVRARGWRRPRMRVHPPKPTQGIRAEAVNQVWHIDVTVIRLLDGSRAYLHAVLDNYSRRILAFRLATSIDPTNTCAVLVEAGRSLSAGASTPELLADSGVENVNHDVDALLARTGLRRVLAQVEVSWSNSMIEAWWRVLKHQWLYLHRLDSFARLQELVGFYVEQHNAHIPHAAFDGHTPDEMFAGAAPGLASELARARADARQRRVEGNRAASCGRCEPGVVQLGGGEKPH